MRKPSSLVATALFGVLLASPALAQDPGFTAPGPVPYYASRGWAPPPAPPPPPADFSVPPAPPPPSRGPIVLAPIVEAPPADSVKQESSGFHLDLGAGTDFPLAVGGVVTAEVPARILFQLSAGVMPSAYAGATDSFLQGIGAYGSNVSKFIRGALSSSYVVRGSVGWRPFEDHGLELMGGYTLVALGGGVSGADVVDAVLAEGGSPQRVGSAMSTDIPIHVTMHNFHATVGWRWLLADDHLVIRAQLSYLQCLASSVSVGLPDPTMEAAVNQGISTYVSPFFTTYVKAPVAGLSLSYRL